MELIEVAFANNAVEKLNYTYLKERVLTRKGKIQIYGSQLAFDKRRKEFNLESISDYLKNH